MRKLKSSSEREKATRRKQWIVGLVLIGLMLLSTLGYAFYNDDSDSSEGSEKINFGGVDFYEINGMWTFSDGSKNYYFTYNPEEVSDVEVNGSFDANLYLDSVIYIVGLEREGASEASTEILGNLQGIYLRSQGACIEGGECSEDWPVKDCSDNLIIFEEGNETRVYENESCVYISGDVIKGADAFIYELFGISPN